MTESNDIYRVQQLLKMGVETWARYRSSPGWIRDQFAAVDHYRQEDWQFEVAEYVLNSPFLQGQGDHYHLAVMVGAEGATRQEFDFGYGRFIRENVPGSLIFGDARLFRHLSGRGPYHIIACKIDGSYARERLSALWQQDSDAFIPLYKSAFFDPDVVLLVRQLLATARGVAGLLSPFEIIEIILGRLLEKAGVSGSLASALPQAARRMCLQKVLNYINDHFRQAIRRSDLAGAAGLSDDQLERSFRVEIGMPPMQYLKKFRLQRAYDLLLQSPSIPVRVVAEACGFNDVRSLYKYFEHEFGLPPAQLRNLPRR